MPRVECSLAQHLPQRRTSPPPSPAQPVPDIVSALLVHTVVRQVHELVPNVLGTLVVSHRCKPDGKDAG